MPKLLNPCVDPIFKALFTDNSPEAHKALTSLLEAILEQKVSNVELLPNELSGECIDDRQTVFDISCLLNDIEPVNIEMQSINLYEAFDKRAEYHVAHLLNHVVKKGTTWDKIPKSYQISVLDFIYDDKHIDVCSHYYMKSENGSTLANRLNVYFIELPKVLNISDDISQLTTTQKWAKYFKYANREDKQEYVKNLIQSEDGIMNAQAVLSKISLDDSMWIKQNHYFEENNRTETIKSESFDKGLAKGLSQGRAEGLSQGRAEGLSQGRAEGLSQGRAEGLHDKAIETAKIMLADNTPLNLIAKYSGLPIEEIKKLK